MTRWSAWVVLFALSACSRSLELPPEPGPGTLQGTVVYTEPGRSTELPAVGAELELVNTSVRTRVTQSNGSFVLGPITRRGGELRITFDVDADGRIDLTRLVELTEVGAGFGRDVSLGQLLLGGNGTVRGRVALGDRPGATAGLSGTTVFMPEGPYVTTTADDGSFVLERLPEGRVTLGFYRAGYAPASAQLTLVANQLFTMGPVTLEPAPSAPSTSRVSGTVALVGLDDASGVTVVVSGASETAVTNAAGLFELPSVPVGLRSFGFVKPGFRTATQLNVLVQGAEVRLSPVTLDVGDSTPPDLDGGFVGPVDAGLVELPDGGFPGPPRAVVDGLPDFISSGTNPINGANSQGVRPFYYRWSVLSDLDAGITIMPSEGFSAASPNLVVPAEASVVGPVRCSLVVEDARGLTSAPTEFTVVLAVAPPQANMGQVDAVLYAGQVIPLGTEGSADPNGTGLVEYRWSASPADAGLEVRGLNDAGTQVELRIPTQVTAPFNGSVTLEVTNGLGLRSANTQFFTVLPAVNQAWSLNPGTFRDAVGGDVVQLTATVSGAASGRPMRYSWAITSAPDGGPQGILANENTDTVTFVAPLISGPAQPYWLTVTATDLSGTLTPTQRSESARVLVRDERPPLVAATSITSGGTASPFGLWVEFDEALATVQPSPGVFVWSAGRGQNVEGVPRFVGRRVLIPLDGFAQPGEQLNLSISGVRDTSGSSIGSTSFMRDYVATWEWPATVATPTVNFELYPALLLESDARGDVAASLLTRGATGVVPYQPLAVPCDAGCALVASAGVTTPSPVGGRTGPHSVWAGGVPFVQLQTGDPSGNAGVLLRRGATGWQALPAIDGTLLTDGVDAYVVRVLNSSVQLLRYDVSGGSWTTTTAALAPSTVELGPTLVTDGGLAQAWGWVVPSTRETYVVIRDAVGDLSSRHHVPDGGGWTNYTFPAMPVATPITDFRLVGPLGPGGDANLVGVVLRSNGSLELEPLGNSSFSPQGFTGVSAFDVTVDATRLWLATIEGGGQLVLYTFSPTEFGGPQRLPGPRDGGTPGSLNEDPACTASLPSVARQGEVVVVAWQERCATGPRRTFLRYVR